MDTGFDVVFGIDMETDIGSFTDRYEGVKYGTPKMLELFAAEKVIATFFWTGHAAVNNAAMVGAVCRAGHETGCHSLVHETLGDPLFPLPNNWPVCDFEVAGRIREATRLVANTSGVTPVSFRCPRLWGSTTVVNELERLGYKADASLPLYFYRTMFRPYHPDAGDWTRAGEMNLVEIPMFCDLEMTSDDPWNRDRDQWPLFRTEGAEYVLRRAEGFVDYVRRRGVSRPTLCFYFHPWEFYPMPTGALDLGEAEVMPKAFITRNCGDVALTELRKLIRGLKERGGEFKTAERVADENR